MTLLKNKLVAQLWSGSVQYLSSKEKYKWKKDWRY